MGELGLNVAKDRDTWHTFVNTIMNTWQTFVNTIMNVDAPEHAENFLIGSGIIWSQEGPLHVISWLVRWLRVLAESSIMSETNKR